MQYIEQSIPGVFVIEPKVFSDQRGYFMESWKESEFEKHIGKVHFLQENESKSVYGVLRGMHAQAGEASQAKLVRVIEGSVLDVAVDARQSSPTFGKYVAVELSAKNKKQFYIPRGFYHGFLVLSPEAIFSYKVDNSYQPQTEVSFHFLDPSVHIIWPIRHDLILSPKDETAPLMKDTYLFE
ncbi:MAG: dTDP-4-dehydrorhamnose 3,5-epimerase [Bacteroidales bacterium]|nr:dTDP-4-dehydrorhamnose 3,5-epimerase [Bacteroidales bacterium]MDD4712785.1 dTDP-4-dehydrorhamnose 3,5-epimerase [Bacteroidales bacterium]